MLFVLEKIQWIELSAIIRKTMRHSKCGTFWPYKSYFFKTIHVIIKEMFGEIQLNAMSETWLDSGSKQIYIWHWDNWRKMNRYDIKKLNFCVYDNESVIMLNNLFTILKYWRLQSFVCNYFQVIQQRWMREREREGKGLIVAK